MAGIQSPTRLVADREDPEDHYSLRIPINLMTSSLPVMVLLWCPDGLHSVGALFGSFFGSFFRSHFETFSESFPESLSAVTPGITLPVLESLSVQQTHRWPIKN